VHLRRRLSPPTSDTEVTVRHEGVPDGVPAEDNETGARMALAALAALVKPG
jgi:hypothetical protein